MKFTQKQCPFCKGDNNCKVFEPKSCWCMTTKVPEELRKLVPDDLKMKSCICKNCVESFLENEKAFIEKYELI